MHYVSIFRCLLNRVSGFLVLRDS